MSKRGSRFRSSKRRRAHKLYLGRMLVRRRNLLRSLRCVFIAQAAASYAMQLRTLQSTPAERFGGTSQKAVAIAQEVIRGVHAVQLAVNWSPH